MSKSHIRGFDRHCNRAACPSAFAPPDFIGSNARDVITATGHFLVIICLFAAEFLAFRNKQNGFVFLPAFARKLLAHELWVFNHSPHVKEGRRQRRKAKVCHDVRAPCRYSTKDLLGELAASSLVFDVTGPY
ncbi:MAG TPA: hypothetical protein VIE65_22420, partial [Methylobacter sp.]